MKVPFTLAVTALVAFVPVSLSAPVDTSFSTVTGWFAQDDASTDASTYDFVSVFHLFRLIFGGYLVTDLVLSGLFRRKIILV